MEFVKRNLWEIERSWALRYLGAVLAISHVISGVTWIYTSPSIFSWTRGPQVCWSFFSGCMPLQYLFLPDAAPVLWIYMGLAVLATLAFLFNRGLTLAWWMSLISFLLLVVFILGDKRLASNTHTLLLFLNTSFLLFPSKPHLMGGLIAAYYVSDGVLKSNLDWLSGYWFKDVYSLSHKALEWMAAAFVMAEIIAAPMIMSRSGQRLSGAIVTLIVVNMVQWSIGKPFGPLVLNLLILFFIFYFIERRRFERETLYQSYVRPEPTKIWVPIWIALFVAAQSLPLWGSYNKSLRTPVTMNQLTIPADCQQYGYAIFENGIRALPEDLFRPEGDTSHCNVDLRLLHAGKLCQQLESEPGFSTLATVLLKRGYSEAQYSVIYTSQDVCQKREAL